ncbi:MAG: hypothetical protein V4450_07930 [Bacteroidota bacterium]
MRTMIALCLLVFIGSSCNSAADKTGAKDSGTAAKPTYAYTIEKPDNWDMGSSQNTAIALSALKAFENKNIDESVGYFADTVAWKSDFIDAKYSKDSLKAMFANFWKGTQAMTVKMDDYESVISKDKKDEYVTIWYKQIMTDMKGKTDSVFLINDFKIAKGKIVSLSESLRHFPVKK